MTVDIKYSISVTLINLTDSSTSKFNKEFTVGLTAFDDTYYNNDHVLVEQANMLDIFSDEIQAYSAATGTPVESIDIDEFEITSMTDNIDVYFKNDSSTNIPLSPIIMCYVHPKFEPLRVPKLAGIAYDAHTIIWTWPEDNEYAHILIDEPFDLDDTTSEHIIAHIPIGQTSYTETNLEPNTMYTRRLINYTAEQTSAPSASVTVQTETVKADIALSEYNIANNYDFTSDDRERESIQQNLEAFHSGVGDFNDLKIYKQMDADFYQKFKVLFEIIGRRTEREKRYDQVGFNYKVCLEAIQEIEEQEGEVTFDVDAYPREWVRLQDYIWSTWPVRVKTKLWATVFLRKEGTHAEDPFDPNVWKPKFKEVWDEFTPPDIPMKELESVERNISVVISLDMSSSLRFDMDDVYAHQNHEKENWEKILATIIVMNIDTKVREKVPDANIQWVIVKWGGYLHYQVWDSYNWQEVNNQIIPNIICYGTSGWQGYTNFYTGLNAAALSGIIQHDVVGQVMITDGYANLSMGNGMEFYACYNYTQPQATDILNSIHSSIPTSMIFLNGTNYIDLDYHNKPDKPGIMQFGKDILARCRQIFGHDNVYYPRKADGSDDDDAWMGILVASDIATWAADNTIGYLYHHETVVDTDPQDATKDGILWHWDGSKWQPQGYINGTERWKNENGKWYRFAGMKFDGWEKVLETKQFPKYNIDDIKTVTVQIDLPDYVFSSIPAPASWITGDTINVLTPVKYDRDSRRTVIPSVNVLNTTDPKSVMCNDLFTLIWNAVIQTPLYKSGYTLPIGLMKDGKETGMDDCNGYLIRGCFIKNTYNYADEDAGLPSNWGISDYEDGLDGSVNTFAEIDKMEDLDYYGDDCYCVEKGDKVWITGYTDAIIYDGTVFVEAELNAYDNPVDTVISGAADYASIIYNRKNNRLTYKMIGGTYTPSHCLDLIEIGDDIYFTSGIPGFIDNLKRAGDWMIIDTMLANYEVLAHNDTCYESPVLNYRFNLEDPDARTPLYEILPRCNPNSNYPHIVILHIYYARNVYITNAANYINEFGDDPIATTSSPYIPLVEHLYKWTLKEWKDGYGNDNGWYIDNYLWFFAAPMIKVMPYYDELPGEGMDSYYGLVNGRYRDDGQDGRKDLTVQTHQFNIPETVTKKHSDSIRIYIMIEEFYPDDALVSYKWAHPFYEKDSITQVNGDYVTFSSDTITVKDVDYEDVIATINFENQEVFDNKTRETMFELQRPESLKQYKNYYIRVQTDNSDVLALRYPTEIFFDEDDRCVVPVSFKGVVNATSKWSPMVHNGYYYLNQHEYYAYSEFDIDANFETEYSKDFKAVSGYVSIDVMLRHTASSSQHYEILRNTRSELMQDEDHFIWVNEYDADGSDSWGLTLKPYIDGEYYKEYYTYIYTSPQLMFPNILTDVGPLHVEYYFEDGSTYLPMEIRSYDNDTGEWCEWTEFANGSVPLVPLSNAYQVRFQLQATVVNSDYTFENYLCCYLDWKDDGDEANITNIVTITDHMTAGPDKAEGIYISKIIDFGCQTSFSLDMFQSNYNESARLYAACATTNKDTLLLENITWADVTNYSREMTGRYLRYMIKIPYGEKVYWVHKSFQTKVTSAKLPYIKSISISGDYEPVDEIQNFINTESFEIPADGKYHTVFNRLIELIGADVLSKGFTENEIEYINVTCTTPNIYLDYDHNVELRYPTQKALETSIRAMTEKAYSIKTSRTPFIMAEQDYYDNDVIVIQGTPQQFCPITVENADGIPYVQLFENSDLDFSNGFNAEHMQFMILHEQHIIDDEPKYIELKRNDYELSTLEIKINGSVVTEGDIYDRINHLIIFKEPLSKGDIIDVQYRVAHSFIAIIDREANTTVIYLYTDKDTLDKPSQYEEQKPITIPDVTQFNISKATFSHSAETDSPHAALNEEYYWSAVNGELRMGIHTGTFNGAFYGNELIQIYHNEVIIRSTEPTKGLNGVIIGYTYDPWGNFHTLSLVTTRGGIDVQGPTLLALVFDYQRRDERVIACIDFTSDPEEGTWADFPDGIRLIVDKNNNKLTCQCSLWGAPDIINPASLITVNLKEDQDLADFAEGVYYGFCNMSQNNSYFKVAEMGAYTVYDVTKKFKVFFETGKHNNKFRAEDLSLNPIYRTDYKGFIYLTDEHNEPYSIKMYCNPRIIKCGGYDKVDVSVEVLDMMGNPVIHKPVAIDCSNGILYKDSDETDMNGVIHFVYESSVGPSVDTVTARIILDDGSLLEESITITNEA